MRGTDPNESQDLEIEQFRELTRNWFSQRQNLSFAELAADLARFRLVVLEELSQGLMPRLNRFAGELRLESFADKQAFARWMNAFTRMLGTVVVCPKTSRPATVVADRSKSSPRGRYQLEVAEVGGGRKRTLSRNSVPSVSLAPIAAPEILSPGWLNRSRPRDGEASIEGGPSR